MLTPLSAGRSRLTQAESRSTALEAARAILIEHGPCAVTLKAVAARMGRTHANLLHHFGSAAGLQRALAESMAETITAKIGAAVLSLRRGETDPDTIVDLTFDAFGREGAGALASWMMLSGDRGSLDPILDAIHRLVESLSVGHEDRPVREVTLALVLMALGDALLGAPMAHALALDRGVARVLALRQLIAMRGWRKP